MAVGSVTGPDGGEATGQRRHSGRIPPPTTVARSNGA
jgi:hypothetical protein